MPEPAIVHQVGKVDSWALNPGRRRNMQANRSRDTRPELAVRRLLHARGLRFRVCFRPVTTSRLTADIVFTRAKVAVFVDGCFWHGCPVHYKSPQRNSEYWATKIVKNQERDARLDALLLNDGWALIRAWEHESANVVADRVEATVRIRSRAPAASVRVES